MKAPSAQAILAVVVAICRRDGALAFLAPTTALTCSRGAHDALAVTQPSTRSALSALPGRASAPRGGVRLAAAREDCKSCMENELLAEEEAAGNIDAAGRREAFEEVTRPASYVTQNVLMILLTSRVALALGAVGFVIQAVACDSFGLDIYLRSGCDSLCVG